MNSIYACARLGASSFSSSRFILSRTVASRFGFGLLPAMLWLTPGEVLAATTDTTETDVTGHTLNEEMYAALPSLRVSNEISKGIEVDVEIIDFDMELEATEVDASESELTGTSEASTDDLETLPQNDSEPSDINSLDLSALDNENTEEE